MATKKELNLKIRQLERSPVKKHEDSYIHIPKPNRIWFGKLFGFLFFTFLSVMNFLLIKSLWIKFNLEYVFDTEGLGNYVIETFHLIVLYPLVCEAIFIELSIIFFVSLFKKLKSYDEGGLISELIYCLICGLILGLIFGLIFGLIGGLISGLISGLILGLILGLLEEFN